MATGIERPQTDAEKNDYQALGTVTPRERFLKRLAAVEMDHVRKSMPFDGQCAKADFSEQVEQLERESEARYGFISPQFIEDNLKMADLNEYGNLTRFDIVQEDDDVEMQNINGLRSSIKTGTTVQYRCKKRKHGVSVSLSNDVYEERFGDKKDKKSEDTKK